MASRPWATHTVGKTHRLAGGFDSRLALGTQHTVPCQGKPRAAPAESAVRSFDSAAPRATRRPLHPLLQRRALESRIPGRPASRQPSAGARAFHRTKHRYCGAASRRGAAKNAGRMPCSASSSRRPCKIRPAFRTGMPCGYAASHELDGKTTPKRFKSSAVTVITRLKPVCIRS